MSSGADRSERIGLAILATVVLLSSVWIAYQARALTRSALAPPRLPELQRSPGMERFRADASYLPDDALLGFVPIEAGPFVMGSDPTVDRNAFANERWSNESYQGRVELPKFFIQKYEVTVAQFRAFAAATGYRIDYTTLAAPGDQPIANISWVDAIAYTRWLTDELKKSSQLPTQLAELSHTGWKVALPTEAQWEKAARGVAGKLFPWGDRANHAFANFGSASSLPVGSFPCEACGGLYDMSGNVWELTSSPYRSYPFDANRTSDPSRDALFVMRGGSYQDTEQTIRAATRGGIDPGARRPFIGFRVVLARD